MNRMVMAWVGSCLASTLAIGPAGAGEADLEPLLRLLVERGVITLEQARSVQLDGEAASDLEDPLLELLVAEGVISAADAAAVQRASQPEDASSPPAVEETEAEASWSDRIEIKGDVRMRYEGFSKDGSFHDDRRDRFRARIRAGIEAAITDRITFGMQLRNGDPDDPVSNNTSFDGGFQFKDFNLAQGYLDIEATDRVDVIVGKFDAKRRWTVSDLQWDDDVTIEGSLQNLVLARGDGGIRGVDLVAYQLILEESGSGRDAYTFGGQLRADLRPGDHDRLGLGVGFDAWDNPQAVADLTLSGRLKGNAVTNLLDQDGQLVSDFEIVNLFAEWKHTASPRWPVKLSLFYYTNLGAKGIAEDQDTGAFGRLQVGDYKDPGQVAFRYSYYYSEPDALFYVFTQSDTSRGSDVKAHRFDLRIGAVARSYFNLTWYNTRPIFREDEPLDRWQMDYIVRF